MDVGVIRLCVLMLGAIACLSIGGIVIVESAGRQAPGFLGTLAGTWVGAIVGILVPIRGPIGH